MKWEAADNYLDAVDLLEQIVESTLTDAKLHKLSDADFYAEVKDFCDRIKAVAPNVLVPGSGPDFGGGYRGKPCTLHRWLDALVILAGTPNSWQLVSATAKQVEAMHDDLMDRLCRMHWFRVGAAYQQRAWIASARQGGHPWARFDVAPLSELDALRISGAA